MSTLPRQSDVTLLPAKKKIRSRETRAQGKIHDAGETCSQVKMLPVMLAKALLLAVRKNPFLSCSFNVAFMSREANSAEDICVSGRSV